MADGQDPSAKGVLSAFEREEQAKQTLANLKAQEEYIKKLGDTAAEVYGSIDKLNEKKRELILQTIAALKQERDALIDIGNSEEDAKKRLTDLAAEIKKAEEEVKSFEKAAKSLGDNLKGAFSDKLKSSIIDLGNTITDKFFKPIGIGATLDAIPALDKTRAEFVKNTGASDNFLKSIIKLQSGFTQFGLTTEQTSKILQSLRLNYNRFGLETDDVNNKLTQSAAMFSKLGFSEEKYMESVSKTSAIFGTSALESDKYQKQLAKTSIALNMNVNQLNQSWLANMKNFAVYGKQGIDQFSKFNAMAKATTIEIGTLQSLSERLTTFEETGTFAGRLNAIAGKDLFDAVTLSTLEGEEKVKYIAERLKAGFDFAEMSPQMLRSISKAAGIEIADLKALTGTGLQDVAKRQAAISDSRLKSDKELIDIAKSSTTSEEQLLATQEASRNATIEATGALEIYKGAMSLATSATQALTAAFGILTPVVASLAAVLTGVIAVGAGVKAAKMVGAGGGAAAGTAGTAAAAGAGTGILSKMASGAKLGIGKAGIAGGVIAGGISGYEEYQKSGDITKAAGAAAKTGTSTVVGSAIGGAIGSLFGGIGAVPGAMIGGMVLPMIVDKLTSEKVEDGELDLKTGKLNKKSFGTLKPEMPNRTILIRPEDRVTTSGDKVRIGPNVGGESGLANAMKELANALAANTNATVGNTAASKTQTGTSQRFDTYGTLNSLAPV